MTPNGQPVWLTVLRTFLFYVAASAVVVAFLPLVVLAWMPRRGIWVVLRVFFAVQIWLLRRICGLDFRVTGLESLPDGPCILASRHEATWETLVLPVVFGNPAVVLKEEILRYPVVGLLVRRLGHIPARRNADLETVRRDLAGARGAVANGRSVLIFPSGTRNPRDRYVVQGGVAVLYRSLGVPCVPIVVDSGRYWPHRSWLRLPGTINVRVLPAIEPGLSAKVFQDRLRRAMYEPARQPVET